MEDKNKQLLFSPPSLGWIKRSLITNFTLPKYDGGPYEISIMGEPPITVSGQVAVRSENGRILINEIPYEYLKGE